MPHTTPAAYCTIRVVSGKGLGGREGGGRMSLMLRTLPAQSGTDMAPLPSVGLTHSAPWPGGFGVLLRFSSLVKRSVSHLKIPALSKDARGSIDPPGSFTHVRRLYLLTKVVLTYLSIFFLSPLSLQSLHPPSLSLLSVRPARRIVSLTLYRRARIFVLSRAQAFSTGPDGQVSRRMRMGRSSQGRTSHMSVSPVTKPALFPNHTTT